MRHFKKRKGLLKTFHNPIFLICLLAVISFPLIFLVLSKKMKAETGPASCKAVPVSSTGFIKTHHLRDNTSGMGVLPTRDGGYLLTGETVMSNAMSDPRPFIIKTDAKGNKVWTRDFSSASNALGEMSSSYVGRLSAETSDGSIIMASDVVDFVDENIKEMYGDILVTKFSPNGNQTWSIMLGDYSIDRPQRMWALPDGGVLLLARFMETGHGNDVADTSTVTTYSVLIRIDKNGKVISSKKMDWDAIDMQRLGDGSLIALANIKVVTPKQPANIVGPEVVMHPLPTMIRLDSNYRVTWSKSLEMIPSEMNTIASMTDDGKFTVGITKIRLAGGDFKAIQQTTDGGFIAFGFNNFLLTQGLTGNVNVTKADTTLRPFVAVKVDPAGNYQWTKKLTTDLISGGVFNDFHVAKTTDGNFVILKGVVRDSDNYQARWDDAGRKQQTVTEKCHEFKCKMPGDENKIPEVKPFAEEATKANEALQVAMASNLELIKTDADFNPMWVKKYDLEREISGYGIQPTVDKGVVVVGSMLTTKMHMVMMSLEPYEETAIIKVDANGGASGCASVTDHSKAMLEDQSSYLVMQNMDVAGAKDMRVNINKKVKEKTANAKNVVRDICKYSKVNVTPACSYINANPVSQPGGTTPTPLTKTWAYINYEKATEGTIGSDKNQQIHDELLPVLKQVFGNQVKMTDSMNSMWLSYIFPRLVTRADVEAVQKKLEAIGYKIDESEGGTLYVSKVGRTLHMTFSIQSPMVGKLEVLL
ncbi:MAG: hypothetical protein WC750_00400 [Patescibacteria group bacterium]|jgi:hypothetical protein